MSEFREHLMEALCINSRRGATGRAVTMSKELNGYNALL